ncbi:hypothetical protein HMPREF9141_0561 [Prevotella multiformis DSM 16608]|uniref:Uncharacterized protein n=1 Tax=Prevotella multiformis DSM 16608 TaxID=888743 RepID=F0F4P5_9BACT|nr:hypothetical protein HMPREF9141_0561 [Prevotella multiformis DSM 16608]
MLNAENKIRTTASRHGNGTGLSVRPSRQRIFPGGGGCIKRSYGS